MTYSGDVLDLSPIEGVKADKHSTGGVGDKTSLVLCPMVAACGLKIAKMSGRGLGHTGGTIDKLESFPGFSTELSEEQFFENVNRHGIAIMGQTANLVPADKKLYALRDVTGTVPSIPLIVSSIMSKKLASGADVTIITDMDQPLGYAVGNALEVKEAIAVLNGEQEGDLLELCLALGGCMLTEAGFAASHEEAKGMLIQAVRSGKALEKLAEMVRAQGGDDSAVYHPELLPQASIQAEVPSRYAGSVSRIHAESVGLVSMKLGGGRATKADVIDPAVGVVLHKKLGDTVEEGESLATVHANDPERAAEAVALLQDCYEFTSGPIVRPPFIHQILRSEL